MEQKKGFLEDGGGFDHIWDGTAERLRRFRDTRWGRLLGVLLIALAVFSIMADMGLRTVRSGLGDPDLHRLLQREAGLPESAGISEAEFSRFAYDLRSVAYGWFSERDIERFKEDFGYNPYSEQEVQLLLESNAMFGSLDDFLLDYGIWRSLITCLDMGIGGWLIGKKNIRLYLVSLFAGLIAALLPVIYFTACFMVDFTETMHFICGLLFASDAWMLSPETSIIARLMPESVLMGIGKHILYELLEAVVLFAAILLAVWLIVLAVEYFERKKEKEEKIDESAEL